MGYGSQYNWVDAVVKSRGGFEKESFRFTKTRSVLPMPAPRSSEGAAPPEKNTKNTPHLIRRGVLAESDQQTIP